MTAKSFLAVFFFKRNCDITLGAVGMSQPVLLEVVLKSIAGEEIRTQRPTPESLVRLVTGGALWSADAVLQHQKDYEAGCRRSRVAYVYNSFVHLAISLADFICGAIGALVLLGEYAWHRQHIHNGFAERFRHFSRNRVLLPLSRQIFVSTTATWMTNHVDRLGQYNRDWKKESVPLVVLSVMTGIREHFPKAEFSITFFGTDPILNVEIGHEGEGHSFVVLVWEEDPLDGSITVLKPRQH